MIEQVYNTLKDTLLKIQRKRKLTAMFQKVTWILTGVYIIFLLVIFTGPFFNDKFAIPISTPLLIAVVILIQVSAVIFGKLLMRFKTEEQDAATKAIKSLFPDLNYQHSHYSIVREILKSKIFAWFNPSDPLNAQHTYGFLKDEVDGAPLHMADIGLVEQDASNKLKRTLMHIPGLNFVMMLYEFVLKNIFTTRSADNVYYTFRGLFCWTPFNKDLSGYTVVLPDTLEASYGGLAKNLQAMNFKRDQLVTLEDPRFEKAFVVYSTDQVEARYILTASMMEQIVALKHKFKCPIMMAFYQQHLYVAVYIPDGVLSFSSEKMSSYKAIEEMYNYIRTAQQIIPDLSLNRRIWQQQSL